MILLTATEKVGAFNSSLNNYFMNPIQNHQLI